MAGPRRGVREALQAIVEDNRGWIAVGQVTAVETHAAWGFLFTVALRPSGQPIQARLAAMGAGAGAGMLWPVAVDDEVLVLLPDADPNRAVILPGLASTAAAIPADWTNATVRVEAVDRDVEVRAGQGASRAEIKIANADGAVTITSGSIRLGSAAAAQAAMLGNVFQVLFNAHVHSTSTGPSGPPAVPLTGSELSAKVKVE